MAVVFRVYGRTTEDFVVVVNDAGGLSRYFNVSEFDIGHILRNAGVGVRHDSAMSMSAFKKAYKNYGA